MPGEPLDSGAFYKYRMQRFRTEYPDVAALFGCVDDDGFAPLLREP